MSLSFPTPRSHHAPTIVKTDKGEHWSVTIANRPVGQKYGKGYPSGGPDIDFDTYNDNFDDEQFSDKEKT